jgi:hypothetical protein
MKQGIIAQALTMLALNIGASSCATGYNVREQALDRSLELCGLLSEPEIETKADGEVKYWYEVERVNISRKLWSSEGIRAIEGRLARTARGVDEKCLQRALREARSHEAE